jgi:hypothetical protein
MKLIKTGTQPLPDGVGVVENHTEPVTGFMDTMHQMETVVVY